MTESWRATSGPRVRTLLVGVLLSMIGMTCRADAQPAAAGANRPPTAQPAAEHTSGSSEATAKPQANLREMLSLLGVKDSLFAGFTDAQPLAESQREPLVQLLSALGRIAPDILAQDARPSITLDQVYEDPAAMRGEAFQLRFDVTRVARVPLPAELAGRFDFDAYYHCQGRIGIYPIELYALHVPASWKLDRAMEAPCSASAVFLQTLPTKSEPAEKESPPMGAASERPPLLFAVNRVAWHPVTLLAYLGVDYGLLEQVTDRTKLTEREVFYQMLAASKRMSAEYLQYQIRRLLKSELELQERLARNRDLPAETRAAAERALERLQSGVSDVVPLFNEPEPSRGRFVVLEGEALRAIEIRVDDPEIERRFNLDHYFEVEIVTPDSQNNPIVCCLAELPPGMPLGESIHESVRVAGFFLKSWAFQSRRSSEQFAADKKQALQVAPLLVGKTLEIITPPRFTPPTQSLQLLAGLAIVLGVSGIAIWRARRNDRRAHERLLASRKQLPAEISLEAPPGDGNSTPPGESRN